MSDASKPASDAERFIAQLNALDHHPTWTEAASLGVPVVDLSREELGMRNAVQDLEQASRGFAAVVDRDLPEATADLADHRQRLEQIEALPGRYFLATGEVVQRDDFTGDAYKSGWWYDQHTTLITTPQGERVHRPGIHPDAAIDPTSDVDNTARVEAGATIGAHARIGPHVHVGRDAAIGAHSVVQDGTWIGTNAQLGPHAWISHGSTIEPHSVLGHHTSVGAGSRVAQGVQIEPYSRLGSGTTTSSAPPTRNQRGHQIANAIENLMRLDRE